MQCIYYKTRNENSNNEALHGDTLPNITVAEAGKMGYMTPGARLTKT